jgi:hypothetical protein
VVEEGAIRAAQAPAPAATGDGRAGCPYHGRSEVAGS